MRVSFAGRNVVCLTAMPAQALDLEPLARIAGSSKPRTQVTNPQVALVEFDRLKVLLTPDGRLQLELPADSRRELSRRAAAEVVRQAQPYALRALGFNGIARVELDEDDVDPVSSLVDDEAVTVRLGTAPMRRGIKLVYPLGPARATLDLLPADDEERTWLGAINRHYASVPDDGELRSAIAWFADLSDGLVGLVSRMIGLVATTEDEHAA